MEEPIVNETVLNKQKRKFTWTPARKAAFEKCVAARKNSVVKKVVPLAEPSVTEEVQESSEKEPLQEPEPSAHYQKQERKQQRRNVKRF